MQHIYIYINMLCFFKVDWMVVTVLVPHTNQHWMLHGVYRFDLQVDFNFKVFTALVCRSIARC